jgi:Glycosyl hydrolase family 26
MAFAISCTLDDRTNVEIMNVEHHSGVRCHDKGSAMFQNKKTGYTLTTPARCVIRYAAVVCAFLAADGYSSSAGATGLTARQTAAVTSEVQTLLLRPAPTSLLAYLNSLSGSGTILSGQWADHFCNPEGGSTSSTYGCYLDQMLPVSGGTPSNVTIANCASGSGGSCTGGVTNTGLTPAILGVQLPTGIAACGEGTTVTQAVSTINGWLAAGGIVEVSWDMPSPTALNGGHCTWNGANGDFPNVVTSGTAAYNTFMYGCSTCSASSPAAEGGVYNAAQALNSLASGYKVVLRLVHEGNLDSTSNWWGTGGGNADSAQEIALFQQIVTYMGTLGVTNVLYEYNINLGSGGYSQNYPGSSYVQIASGDLYCCSTQSGVTSLLSGSTNGFRYLNGLGVPVFLAESGVDTADNDDVTQFTYNNNIWDQAIQEGSGITNLVGDVIWNQHWCLQCQLSALSYMQNTVTRSQLPLIRN